MKRTYVDYLREYSEVTARLILDGFDLYCPSEIWILMKWMEENNIESLEDPGFGNKIKMIDDEMLKYCLMKGFIMSINELPEELLKETPLH